MEQYTQEEFESFMTAMKKMSDTLRSSGTPDFIFAPVTGSVPLIDILSIINRHFPLDCVEYPPNSSRFRNREGLMDKWYHNFLSKNYSGKKMSIACIDEVISGASASKGYSEFEKALDKFGRENNIYLGKKIKYHIFGIGEPMINGAKRNRNFSQLVNQKKARVFESTNIITSDNVALNPVRLEVKGINGSGRNIYLPKIHSLNYTDSYLNLLYNAATYCGRDPNKITPSNTIKMRESLERYLE